MKLFALISLVLCLTLSAACSTGPAKPQPPQQVFLDPPAPLLQMCAAPVLVPSKTNGDIISNSLARQLAFDVCDSRHACLVRWYEEAKAVAAKKGAAMVSPIPEGCDTK
jgi:hypothetical protein